MYRRNTTLLVFILALTFLSCTKQASSNSNNGGDTGDDGDPGTNNLTVNVTTVAGKANDKGNAEDGNGGNARFWSPGKMIYDNRNSILYIADGSVIRCMDEQLNVSTYLPLNAIGNSYDEILDICLAPGSGGSLYITTKANELWRIVPNGTHGKPVNLASRDYAGNETGVLNTCDHFDRAVGLATGANGEIYFFNQSYNTLHRITLTSATAGIVEPFAGRSFTQPGGDGQPYPFADGAGDAATFNSRVQDITSDAAGNIYVADFDNNIIRKVTPAGEVTSLFPFKGFVGLDVDGLISSARSNNVIQITCTPGGDNIYFASFGNAAGNTFGLRLLRQGKDVTTLVGHRNNNYGDGDGQTAGLAEIGGLAVTPDGKTIYLSEPGMKVIRKVTIQ